MSSQLELKEFRRAKVASFHKRIGKNRRRSLAQDRFSSRTQRSVHELEVVQSGSTTMTVAPTLQERLAPAPTACIHKRTPSPRCASLQRAPDQDLRHSHGPQEKPLEPPPPARSQFRTA